MPSIRSLFFNSETSEKRETTVSRLLPPASSSDPSSWLVRQLPGSSAYLHYIAPYLLDEKVIPLDSIYGDEVSTLYSFLCTDPKSPISEFVIASHSNKHKVPQKKGIISILLFLRTGIANQIINLLFLDTDIAAQLINPEVRKKIENDIKFNFHLLENLMNDAKPRFGLTKTCLKPEEHKQIRDMITFIDAFASLGESLKEEVLKFIDPKDNSNMLSIIPYDAKSMPSYLRDYTKNAISYEPHAYYDRRFDREIVSGLPEIHRAILENKIDVVRRLLHDDPMLVNAKDPWGMEAHELAYDIGQLDIFLECFYVRETFFPNGYRYIDIQGIYRDRFKRYEKGLQEISSDQIRIDRIHKADPEKKREAYHQKISQTPIPFRSKLHQACVEGDLGFVQLSLIDAPHRLEEQDPRGYTLLILAAANGHAHILKWLIKVNASLKTVNYTLKTDPSKKPKNISLNPIDSASTPETMGILLHHYIDPEAYNHRLKKVIEENDIPMAEVMFYYLHKLPIEKNGLSAIDLILKESSRNKNLDMFSLFLNYYDDYVLPVGPYDTHLCERIAEKTDNDPNLMIPQGPFAHNLSEEVVRMLEEHNQKIRERKKIRDERPKIQSETLCLDEAMIETHLITKILEEDLKITSTIKGISSLNDDETSSITAFVMNILTSENDISDEDIQENLNYLNSMLVNHPEKFSFINLFYCKNKIVGCVFFEIEQICHLERPFILFNVKLALNDKDIASPDLIALAFRIPLILKISAPKTKVFIQISDMRPGYPSELLPKFLKFSPKHALSIDSISYINKDSHGATCRTEKNDESTTRLFYEINTEIMKEYFQELSFYDLNKENFLMFSGYWEILFERLFKEKLDKTFENHYVEPVLPKETYRHEAYDRYMSYSPESRYFSPDKTKPSVWVSRRLPNSKFYVPHFDNYQFHKKPIRPSEDNGDKLSALYSFRCIDPKKPISEVVIGIHDCLNDEYQKERVISIQIFVRIGVINQLVEAFFNAEITNAKITASFLFERMHDLRPRIQLITTCKKTEECNALKKFIGLADSLVPFEENLKKQLMALIDPKQKESIISNIPYDEKAKAPYLQDHGTPSPYSCYDKQFDNEIVSSPPEIHIAILQNNLPTVRKLLKEDPTLAYAKDPWGTEAHELACEIGEFDIFQECFDARKDWRERFYPKSCHDANIQELYRVRLERYKQNLSSMTSGQVNQALISANRRIEQKRKAYETRIIESYFPTRSELHKACIIGDLSSVETILEKEPLRLEEKDPRGYTPLLLAAANGHTTLLKSLINRRASLQTVHHTLQIGCFGESRDISLRLIENADTPEIMEILLSYEIDLDAYEQRLKKVIEENDLPMASVMFQYLHRLPMESDGLSALDLVIRESSRHEGIEMLSLFLNHYNNYVPNGPYDRHIHQKVRENANIVPSFLSGNSPFSCTVSEEIAQMLEQHNQKIANQKKERKVRIAKKYGLPIFLRPKKAIPLNSRHALFFNADPQKMKITVAQLLKPLISPLQAPSWSARQLRDNGAYRYLSPPYDLPNREERIRPSDPLAIYSFICTDPRKPIDEFVIASHANKLDGKKVISIRLYARTGVVNQILSSLPHKISKFYMPGNFIKDARASILITANCVDREEWKRLDAFINFIDDIVPLGDKLIKQLKKLIAPNTSIIELDDIPLDRDARPPYFYNEQITVPFSRYYICYHQIFDKKIPSEIPEIHAAILLNEMDTIKEMLEENPNIANMKDPWGIEAYSLARRIGSLELFKEFYNAREKLSPNGFSDAELQRSYQRLVREWEKADHDILTRRSSYPITRKKASELREKRIAKYLEKLCNIPFPIRSELHQACIEGKLEVVENTLQKQPEHLEKQDPRGYTPLLLAAANGHVELLKWLINQGASLRTVEYLRYDDRGLPFLIRPIDNASTPEIMEILLQHYIDPHDYNDRLEKAIMENDISMAEVMLYYLHKLPTDRGLSALDFVIKETCRHERLEMLSLFLSYYDDYVPEGPYDLNLCEFIRKATPTCDPNFMSPEGPFAYNIPEKVAQMLKAHNEKIARKEKTRTQRPKIYKEELDIDGKSIKTHLKTEDNIRITSTIKPISSISTDETDPEFKELYALFDDTFKMRIDDTEENRKKYLKGALGDNPEKFVFINLFHINNKIVAYATFEIETAFHPEKGYFTLLHIKLVASSVSMGLINLVFRMPLVLKLLAPKTKLIVFMKLIYPGYVLCLLPKGLEFFPKQAFSENFMSYIVDRTRENLYGKTIPAKLEVKTQPNRSNFPLEYYKHLLGKNTEDAMAVCYEIDEETMQKYFSELSFHDVNQENILTFSENWKMLFENLLPVQDELPIRSQDETLANALMQKRLTLSSSMTKEEKKAIDRESYKNFIEFDKHLKKAIAEEKSLLFRLELVPPTGVRREIFLTEKFSYNYEFFFGGRFPSGTKMRFHITSIKSNQEEDSMQSKVSSAEVINLARIFQELFQENLPSENSLLESIQKKNAHLEENRKGLPKEQCEKIMKELKLPERYMIGKAINDGGCFFDGLAQFLNATSSTEKHTEKSLRELCHRFYLEHKESVDALNSAEFGGSYAGDEYYKIQYTKPECDKSFHNQPPLWGRSWIEGRILCHQLKLPYLYIIELIKNPEDNESIIPCYFKVTEDKSEAITENQFSSDLDSNAPILIVDQGTLHYIPILPKQTHEETYDEEEEPLEDLEDRSMRAAF